MLHCASGDDALDFLYHRGRYTPATAPRPGIILLDLNLPGTDGREVLAEIKAEHGLADIPVVVLTTSADQRDVEACYQAGANSYVQKPVDLDALHERDPAAARLLVRRRDPAERVLIMEKPLRRILIVDDSPEDRARLPALPQRGSRARLRVHRNRVGGARA